MGVRAADPPGYPPTYPLRKFCGVSPVSAHIPSSTAEGPERAVWSLAPRAGPWYSPLAWGAKGGGTMSLGLETIRGRGRPKAQIEVALVRPVTRADIALASVPKGMAAPPLKRLRDRHHALARALSSGMSEADAAALTGYDISRVSILKADPTFRELLEFYRGTVTEAYLDMHAQLAALGMDAADELQHRLETNPESLENKELMALVTISADRTGHGPQSKSLNVNVNVGLADRMQQAMRRARGEA